MKKSTQKNVKSYESSNKMKKSSAIKDYADKYDIFSEDESDNKIDNEESYEQSSDHEKKKKVSKTKKGDAKVIKNKSDTTPVKPKKNVKTNTGSSAKKSNKKEKLENEITGPLTGYTIVCTGIIEGLEREDLQHFLKMLGAKTPSSVSGKTTYLVYGEKLEGGNRHYTEGNKYQKAIEKRVNVINIQELNQLLKEVLHDENFDIFTVDLTSGNFGKASNIAEHPAKNSPVIAKPASVPTSSYCETSLWVNKYAPAVLNNVLGNKKSISSLREWIQDWNDVVLLGNKKATKFKGRGVIENVNAKACLIHGPPGIGKTTAVRLLAEEMGYKIFELNASDQRNKAIINKSVGFLSDNKTLDYDITSAGDPFSNMIKSKHLMIMDEIDGVGGNDDRGGIQALIAIIKQTKIPIICICNDKSHPKLKSLKNSCYEITFARPTKTEIAKRLLEIANKEGIKAEMNALEFLVESTGSDIRQSVSSLEFFSRKPKEGNQPLHYSYNPNLQNIKDQAVLLNNFDATRKLLTNLGKKIDISERINLYFIDPDFIPLLIQENYIGMFSNENDLENLAQAADCISMSDIFDKQIRTNNNWKLQVDKGFMVAVAATSYGSSGVGNVEFTKLFGQMSKKKKIMRQIQEFKRCFSQCPSGAINLEMCPLLTSIILNILNEDPEDSKEKVTQIVDLLLHLHFSPELYKENLIDLMKDGFEQKIYNKFVALSSSLKSALTRELNNRMRSKGTTNKGKGKGKRLSQLQSDDEESKIGGSDDDNAENDEIIDYDDERDNENFKKRKYSSDTEKEEITIKNYKYITNDNSSEASQVSKSRVTKKKKETSKSKAKVDKPEKVSKQPANKKVSQPKLAKKNGKKIIEDSESEY